VAGAYLQGETYLVTFSGRSERRELCSFEYWPGGEPRAQAIVHGPPEDVEAMIAPVVAAFPFQRSVLFISRSNRGSRSHRVAEALKVMMDQNLLVADAHIAVVTRDAAKSHWVTWEVASSWARQKTVIPLFVGVEPKDVEGALRHLVQGVKLEDAKQLTRAIEELLSAVGGKVDSPLSAEEFAPLTRAAE
jgi:hypothetical protein